MDGNQTAFHWGCFCSFCQLEVDNKNMDEINVWFWNWITKLVGTLGFHWNETIVRHGFLNRKHVGWVHYSLQIG